MESLEGLRAQCALYAPRATRSPSTAWDGDGEASACPALPTGSTSSPPHCPASTSQGSPTPTVTGAPPGSARLSTFPTPNTSAPPLPLLIKPRCLAGRQAAGRGTHREEGGRERGREGRAQSWGKEGGRATDTGSPTGISGDTGRLGRTAGEPHSKHFPGVRHTEWCGVDRHRIGLPLCKPSHAFLGVSPIHGLEWDLFLSTHD